MDSEKPSFLDLSERELRELSASILQLGLEHWRQIPAKPVWSRPDRQQLDSRLREPIPELPRPWDSVRETLETVFSSQGHLAHPRFFAFVPSPNNVVSCLADFLVSVHNPFAGNWLEGSGAETIESVVIGWLCRELGYPPKAGGIFLSGGSLSNLTALAAAREWRFGRADWTAGVIYLSDQTHSSVRRGLRILGFRDEQCRVIPSDEDFRLSVSTLQQQIDDDRKSGVTPFCVVATAGTVNTGAIDPLDRIAALCRENQMWLHVDGAYGAAAVLCKEGKALLAGLDQAQSVTMDPHKWLFQPFPCSCLLVREPVHLLEAFHTRAEYLQDAEGEWNLFDYGPELTRPFRAFKLWLSIQYFGAKAFREAIARGFSLARQTEACIRQFADWEILTAASMSIVTFRFHPGSLSPELLDRLNREIAEEAMSGGFAFLVTTQVKGKTALRICTVNPRTSEADIVETVHHLNRLAQMALSRYGLDS